VLSWKTEGRFLRATSCAQSRSIPYAAAFQLLTFLRAALSTRRPTMLRYNNWISDCTEYLQKSSAATLLDKQLAAWVGLLRLCEEITSSFGYDNDVVSLSEPRVQLMLKSFEKRFELWSRDLDSELWTGKKLSSYCEPNLKADEF
jgi:hypothetical protein